MFEKSLLDLIRGLRYHKGNEKEYIQSCLKECRAEVRSQDMDVKATALLKLVYLEMVGHDMSWASFHVLEVMSSAKLHQKRIGYLAAVQSFRSDTEVLMLATNLLKKDLNASSPITIQLPIATLPHIITPSLALSVLPDLLPRMTHSHRVIRKKTIVTLYRMALVYPETLRAAWPKIKDRLMDPTEDPSVTAAIVNVVCELGWRRPHDFLPLAPRLFELLVDGGNNWMAIKLIKLFATLTPLEPRLVRKLLPPLTDIIRTTPAMSLLYECINGIIQGGILGSDDDDISGREEIASLCVSKLRGMVTIHGDPNLKYVALLAFNKIAATHPLLVAEQEDVIMECIDSPDISIRSRALDLVQGMVSSDNLMSIVGRLMRQLKQSSSAEPQLRKPPVRQIEFRADPDAEEEAAEAAAKAKNEEQQQQVLPEDYKMDVIHRILSMCAQNNYSNVTDFDWYIDILTQLLRTVPTPRASDAEDEAGAGVGATAAAALSERVGNELRNVAVKVMVMRPAAVRAADAVIVQLSTEAASASAGQITSTALKPIAWMVGEYALLLPSADETLSFLLQTIPRIGSGLAEVLATSLQSLLKLFAFVAGNDQVLWSAERKASVSLLMARIVHVLEPLSQHPSLEVQERAVEISELLKLAAEAAAAQPASTDQESQYPPLLLTEAIPSLFRGWELKSVAVAAQRNVPMPASLDLDEPIHPNLGALLAEADQIHLAVGEVEDDGEFDAYYNQRAPPTSVSSAEPAIHRLQDSAVAGEQSAIVSSSYQQEPDEDSYLDADILARRKAERQERNKDDPFYIQDGGYSSNTKSTSARTSTPIHDILQTANGQSLDIDAIPVMQLDLSGAAGASSSSTAAPRPTAGIPIPRAARPRIVVAADEMLAGSSSGGRSTPGGGGGFGGSYDSETVGSVPTTTQRNGHHKKTRQSGLLQVDSSSLGLLDLEDDDENDATKRRTAPFDYERQQRADAEMAQALKEVEKRRLEMQRANERVQVAPGVSAEGAAVVTKKKKKSTKGAATKGTGTKGKETVDDATKPKKKKKKAATTTTTDTEANAETGDTVTVKPKKKKKTKKAVVVDLQGPDLAEAA